MKPIPFGLDAEGRQVHADLHRAHTILAGATRSGKSSTSYVLLAGVARDRSAVVVGCDPSALLLAPFEDVGQEGLVTGTADLPAVVAVLDRVVRLMDGRIANLRRLGVDQLVPSPSLPTVLVVLEEYAGLLAACDAYDAAQKPGERLKPRVLSSVGRLLREGAKAQVLAFTVLQRPDAAVLGGAERAQYARRITHRLDNADGVRMLNETADGVTVERLMSAAPGVGLLNEAGQPHTFFRSALMGYAAYADQVRTHYRPTTIDPQE